jgi:hypothetical protein
VLNFMGTVRHLSERSQRFLVGEHTTHTHCVHSLSSVVITFYFLDAALGLGLICEPLLLQNASIISFSDRQFNPNMSETHVVRVLPGLNCFRLRQVDQLATDGKNGDVSCFFLSFVFSTCFFFPSQLRCEW